LAARASQVHYSSKKILGCITAGAYFNLISTHYIFGAGIVCICHCDYPFGLLY